MAKAEREEAAAARSHARDHAMQEAGRRGCRVGQQREVYSVEWGVWLQWGLFKINLVQTSIGRNLIFWLLRQVALELEKLREGQSVALVARSEAQDAKAQVLKQESAFDSIGHHILNKFLVR